MKRFLHHLCLLALTCAASAKPAYVVKDIPDPQGAVIEAGGVDHWPDGTLVISTRRGEVWTRKDDQWKRFASGLLEPMGLSAGKVGEVHIVQTPELTRLIDTNGDGVADRHETVTADWEIPGATADFVYGLPRDPQGNFYGTFHTTHGPWAKKSLTPSKPKASHSINNYGGPMGAPVIGRGWSFQVSPEGKLTWWSSGLRAPNGVAFNAAGDLFATDNQGDWVGTSAMHHIERGDFHGHPSSYTWDPKRTISLDGPLTELAQRLDKIRKRPAVLFPHGILGNSPSEPVLAPQNGSFGPFQGQFFVGDNVAPLLSRVYLEKVGGEYQGACFPFMREQGLRKALCRMTFSPEGKLIVAYGCRGWGPATTGMQEVSWKGTTPFEMQKIKLLKDGFAITFTKPLAVGNFSTAGDFSKAFTLRSFRYKYHHTYGSPQVDSKALKIEDVSLSADRRVLTLKVDGLEPGKVCEFKLKGIVAEDGSQLANAEAYYTLNRMIGEPGRAEVKQHEFFPICMDTHDAAKRSLAEQAKLFRELGYDGCGHICQDLGYGNITHPANTTLEERAATLEAEDLRLIHAYGRIYLQKDQAIDLKRIEAMMPTLKKHRSELVLLLLGDRKASLDDKAVELLGAIADIAKPHGVRISIYPHSGDYTQTAGEALRIVKRLNRPDEVGVMFTFGHWKNVDSKRDLRTVLTEAKPWLHSVSINGTHKKGAAVLPLGQGDYDVRQVMTILDELEFKGPVALMCWNIRGDAREHLTSSMKQWKSWTQSARLKLDDETCSFETAALKGRIGDGRFTGLNQVLHKDSGTIISGSGRANRHGLLTLYRVFTRNQRYGNAAYDWKDRKMHIEGDSVVLHWPANGERPFDLTARYTFPSHDEVNLKVEVNAKQELTDFEVQVASYFDPAFPVAEVMASDKSWASSPKELGKWHAFPRNARARVIIEDGRWKQGPSPVTFTFREAFSKPLSRRAHKTGLVADLSSSAEDCFAIYTAHDGESHFSNYHALFGRTIAAGQSASAEVSLKVSKR